MNPLWYVFPFVGLVDYIQLVESYATWRTNVVMSSMEDVLTGVMLSEAGYSSCVVRSKLPMFGLVHSRPVKVIACILNAPFAVPKLLYTTAIGVVFVVMHFISPITRFLGVMLRAPSYGFYQNQLYLRTIRRFPYYLSKRFFEDHRSYCYNLGYSIALPRQIPLASFVFGYIEIFEEALFAIDMEKLRDDNDPQYRARDPDFEPLEYQRSENFKGFYGAEFTDPCSIPSEYYETEKAKKIIKLRNQGVRYDETSCKEAYRILKEEYGIVYPDALKFPIDGYNPDDFDWVLKTQWADEVDGIDLINLFSYADGNYHS